MLRAAGGVVTVLTLLIVLTQDFQIYAELSHRLLQGPAAVHPPVPTAMDGFVRTVDGEMISYRRWGPTGSKRSRLRAAILSQGNAGTMDGYHTIPLWLTEQGIAAYVYDYRGYGRSTGWPSERGIYRDIEAIWNEVQRREQITPAELLLFGHSLGGGPAAYLAETRGAAVLITAATYTSVPDRVARHPYFSLLAPFVWTNFPNRERIARLQNTCLIVLHAGHDDGMPYAVSRQLYAAYRGASRAFFAEHPDATHGDIIRYVPALAEPLLAQCPGL
ncbi:MAG TPA: alpha/beta fold hydrolase [Bryobacteraceae bacterium]|nr:alpha/beta fold hydrolase [Bryobacteraceae bacterium]